MSPHVLHTPTHSHCMSSMVTETQKCYPSRITKCTHLNFNIRFTHSFIIHTKLNVQTICKMRLQTVSVWFKQKHFLDSFRKNIGILSLIGSPRAMDNKTA